MSTVVFPDGIQYLPYWKLMIQLYFKKADQHKRQKTSGEVCVDMGIRPYIDRPGFKEGFRHLEGVFNSGKATVNIPHLLIAHFQLAGHDRVVAVIFFFFPYLFQVKQQFPSFYDLTGRFIKSDVPDIGTASFCSDPVIFLRVLNEVFCPFNRKW